MPPRSSPRRAPSRPVTDRALLRAAVAASGLPTDAAFAAALGVDRATLWRWGRGLPRPARLLCRWIVRDPPGFAAVLAELGAEEGAPRP